jgi:hypothetical protein
VVPEDIHDFFVGAAGVAGALIGLLFVALSVVGERLARAEVASQVHRIRAAAALLAFTDSLAVSLFALVPGEKIGWTSVSVGIGGLAFILAAVVSLLRMRPRRLATARDVAFLLGLAVVFFLQLTSGLNVLAHPGDSGTVNTIAILVIASFLIGISRAWELIGGPSFGLGHELFRLASHADLAAGQARAAAETGAGAETGAAADAGPVKESEGGQDQGRPRGGG